MQKSFQGRRRVLKSGMAIEQHRHSARAEGASGGEHELGGNPPSRKGGSGISPENFF